MSSARRILQEALALPPAEREELVGALSTSLDPIELSPEWEAELANRLQSIESGEAVLHEAEVHLDQLRQKYRG